MVNTLVVLRMKIIMIETNEMMKVKVLKMSLKMSLLPVWMHQWGNKQGDKCLGHS